MSKSKKSQSNKKYKKIKIKSKFDKTRIIQTRSTQFKLNNKIIKMSKGNTPDTFKFHKSPDCVVLCVRKNGKINRNKTLLSSVYFSRQFNIPHDLIMQLINSEESLYRYFQIIPHKVTFYKNGKFSSTGTRLIYLINGELCIFFLIKLMNYYYKNFIENNDDDLEVLNENIRMYHHIFDLTSWFFLSIDEKENEFVVEDMIKTNVICELMSKRDIPILNPENRHALINKIKGTSSEIVRFMISD